MEVGLEVRWGGGWRRGGGPHLTGRTCSRKIGTIILKTERRQAPFTLFAAAPPATIGAQVRNGTVAIAPPLTTVLTTVLAAVLAAVLTIITAGPWQHCRCVRISLLLLNPPPHPTPPPQAAALLKLSPSLTPLPTVLIVCGPPLPVVIVSEHLLVLVVFRPLLIVIMFTRPLPVVARPLLILEM